MGDKRENKGGEESGKGSKWAGERQIEDMITSCNVWATVGLCFTKHNRKLEYSECGTQIIAINC